MPNTTYILIDDITDSVRRIFTDGRDFPDDFEPTYTGYSIGKWVDTDGDGSYDMLEVETRLFKGPRVYDNTGLMLHPDNKSIIKERHLSGQDRSGPPAQRDDGHRQRADASLDGDARHTSANRHPQPYLAREMDVPRAATTSASASENYLLSADGLLMPAKKDQAPPDLRYFDQAQEVTTGGRPCNHASTISVMAFRCGAVDGCRRGAGLRPIQISRLERRVGSHGSAALDPRRREGAADAGISGDHGWNTADQQAGGHGTEPSWTCLGPACRAS